MADPWLDRVLALIHGQNQIRRIADERRGVSERLHRLGRADVNGLHDEGSYRREKNRLADWLAALVIPGVEAARGAGLMLDDPPRLWSGATFAKRHEPLVTVLDVFTMDRVDECRVVAIRPKPAFRPLLEIAPL